MSRSPPDLSSVRRALVVKWSALGDLVIATGIIEDIHRSLPRADLDLNTFESGLPLFADDDRFDRVFAVNLRDRGQRLARLARWLREVRAGRYDVVFDLQNNDRSRIALAALRLSGRRTPLLVGYHRAYPYHLAPGRADPPEHVFQGLRAVVGAAGISSATPGPVLRVSPERRAAAAARLAGLGMERDEFVVLCPGSQAGGYLKRWGAERFAALARHLREVHRLRSLIIGGPDDTEECARVAALAENAAVDICGQTALLDLVPIGEAARAVIANDTAPAHVLAAAGRPIVSICGPTDPERVKPVAPRVEALQADVPCKSCYRRECPNGHVCMERLTGNEVLAALARLGVLGTG